MEDTLVELIREGKDITTKLTIHEKIRLNECQSIIKKGFNTFLEVGQALAEIRDNRLYRETHGTFEKYCKDIWDISRMHAHNQINGYETVCLLESKCKQLFTNSEKSSEGFPEEQEEKCIDCPHRKALANTKYKGVKIPNEHGKCTRPEGLCEKHSLTEPPAQQKIILPINEAQTRHLRKLSPDDQVKAWMLVLEKLNQDPRAKLTSGFINKVVKEIKGEVVRDKIKQTKSDVEKTDLVTPMFTKQYQVLLDIVSEEQNNGWRKMKRAEVIKHIEALLKIVKSDD